MPTKLQNQAYELGQQIDAFIDQQMTVDESIMVDVKEHFGFDWKSLSENGALLIQNFEKLNRKAFWSLVNEAGDNNRMKYGWMLRQYRNSWSYKLKK